MRICLFAASCAGKSTTAAWLFSELKLRLKSIELVTEYCKFWAYSGRKINEFDQIYLFGKQMQYEYRFLSNGVKNIVTDSPTFLASVYADLYYKDINISAQLDKINQEYDKKYPSFNIFLERKDKPYIQEGRYQTLEEAKDIDYLIRQKVLDYYKFDDNLIFSNYLDRDRILEEVLKRID